MKGYDASTYGDRIAHVYDELYGDKPEGSAAVAALAELAGPGPVLELAIGTGRLALPLAERGLEVHGIDASREMVAKLRAKPGGDRIPVTIGDFADVGVEGRYRLIFVAFNTLFALLSQDEQIRCFENVGAHLTDDGVFVVEAFVPDPARFRGGRIAVTHVELDHVWLNVTVNDEAKQTSDSHHIRVAKDGVELYPIHVRWSWPSELDLMARLAGLRLRERCGGWGREPFMSESEQHVSVYEKG